MKIVYESMSRWLDQVRGMLRSILGGRSPVTPCHSPKWLNSAKLRDRVVTDAVFQSLFPHYLSSNKGYQSVIEFTSSTFSNFEPHRAKFSKDIRGGRKVGHGHGSMCGSELVCQPECNEYLRVILF